MFESGAVHIGVLLLFLAALGIWITVRAHGLYIRAGLGFLGWLTLMFASVAAGAVVGGIGFLVYNPAIFTLSVVLVGIGFVLAVLVGGACGMVAFLRAYFWEYEDLVQLTEIRAKLSMCQRLAGTIPPGFQASGTPSAIAKRAGIFYGLVLLGGPGALTWWLVMPSLHETTIIVLLFPLFGVIVGVGFIVLSLMRSK